MSERRSTQSGHFATSGPDIAEPGLQHRMDREANRLSSQHEQLDVFFLQVTESLAAGSLRATRIAFTRFADALEAHLALEEGVFFPALRGLEPGLTEELTALTGEHGELRDRLDAVADLLARGSIESLRTELSSLGDEIRAHESREEILLQSIQSGGGASTPGQKG